MQCNSFCPITFSTAQTCYVCSYHGRCEREKEKAAASATNTDNGKAGKYETENPTCIITKNSEKINK